MEILYRFSVPKSTVFPKSYLMLAGFWGYHEGPRISSIVRFKKKSETLRLEKVLTSKKPPQVAEQAGRKGVEACRALIPKYLLERDKTKAAETDLKDTCIWLSDLQQEPQRQGV